MSTKSYSDFSVGKCNQMIRLALLDFPISEHYNLKKKVQLYKNSKGFTRKDLDMESLGVLTSAFDLPNMFPQAIP